MSSAFNEERFTAALRRELNAIMAEAAEPIIRKALSDVETVLRAKIAASVVSLVETSYSLERDGRDLLIRVELPSHQP